MTEKEKDNIPQLGKIYYSDPENFDTENREVTTPEQRQKGIRSFKRKITEIKNDSKK